MNSAYIKYLKHLLLFSTIVGLFAFTLKFFLPKHYLTPALPFLFVFFFASSLLSFFYLLQSTHKRFIKFVNTFLAIILIKLFLYVGVMIAYVFMNRSDAVPFMLSFFILYLCYTIFESVSIIKYTQPANPNEQAQ
jgi:hypothetical protein